MKLAEKLSGIAQSFGIFLVLAVVIVLWEISSIIPYYPLWVILWGIAVILAILFAPFEPFIRARNSGEWFFFIFGALAIVAILLVVRL